MGEADRVIIRRVGSTFIAEARRGPFWTLYQSDLEEDAFEGAVTSLNAEIASRRATSINPPSLFEDILG